VRAAGAHADLTWASDRVRTEIGGSAPETENPPHVDTMAAC
jgi:DNA polymerase-3 subunit epsilon